MSLPNLEETFLCACADFFLKKNECSKSCHLDDPVPGGLVPLNEGHLEAVVEVLDLAADLGVGDEQVVAAGDLFF